ncbi:hypothetical protein ACMHYJ_05250 [Castellaniella hirudinis]|uniref:hypothetical protein n=1 Tax=Castellaniella hirudinis TaxID=1144617 RepID=UPI0039C0D065
MIHQDNQQLRELLSLPPIQPSASTAMAIPEMPPQEVVTGDQEIDTVLWLQKVVATGNRGLIDKALEAAKQIKTPMKDLGMRYANHIAKATGNAFGAAFASFGFGELEDQAKRSIQRAALRHEAISRFSTEEALFAELPAERACRLALKRLKRDDFGMYDDAHARAQFEKRSELVPGTISDCLYAIEFWGHLYSLRNAVDWNFSDLPRGAYAHECYAFFMLADIRPRSREEAIAAFEHVLGSSRGDWAETDSILRNLVVSGWRGAAKDFANRLINDLASLDDCYLSRESVERAVEDVVQSFTAGTAQEASHETI